MISRSGAWSIEKGEGGMSRGRSGAEKAEERKRREGGSGGSGKDRDEGKGNRDMGQSGEPWQRGRVFRGAIRAINYGPVFIVRHGSGTCVGRLESG